MKFAHIGMYSYKYCTRVRLQSEQTERAERVARGLQGASESLADAAVRAVERCDESELQHVGASRLVADGHVESADGERRRDAEQPNGGAEFDRELNEWVPVAAARLLSVSIAEQRVRSPTAARVLRSAAAAVSISQRSILSVAVHSIEPVLLSERSLRRRRQRSEHLLSAVERLAIVRSAE